MAEDALELLREKAQDFGILLSGFHLDLFRIYLAELWEWNRRTNLTGMSTQRRMAVELFLDSLVPAPYLPATGRMLDVGSGSGFPALPLKILLPALDLQLIEANRKKVSFLRQVVRLLGLGGIQLIHGRLEDTASALNSTGYDLVTAKALAPLEKTITMCAPFVAPGGLLVGYWGAQAEQTLAHATEVMDKHGVSVEKKVCYRLPGKKEKRWIGLLRKADGNGIGRTA